MVEGGELAAEPLVGRVFRTTRPVRLGDTDPTGRLRLDALARYLQDVSNDDTHDAGLGDAGVWVVRRTVLDVRVWPRPRERLALATFCSGIGLRWAERRIRVHGDAGGVVEAASLWIHLDATGSRPARLDDRFEAVYGEAAGGRGVTARLHHADPPPDLGRTRWPLRATDFDVMRHVNNAAYWAVAEELLARRPGGAPAALRAELEFRRAIGVGQEVDLAVAGEAGAGPVQAWLLGALDGEVHASTTLVPTA